MYKNYLIDYTLRNKNNHPLSSCKWDSIKINTTNNNLVNNQKQIFNIVNNIIPILGQYPKLKKAKNSVSAFGIRAGTIIGTFTTLHKKSVTNFLKKFIFSILPSMKTWQTIKKQKINKAYYIYNIGFSNLSFWYEVKGLNYTGLHIKFIIKQLSKEKDFLFFLSKYNLNLKLK